MCSIQKSLISQYKTTHGLLQIAYNTWYAKSMLIKQGNNQEIISVHNYVVKIVW